MIVKIGQRWIYAWSQHKFVLEIVSISPRCSTVVQSNAYSTQNGYPIGKTGIPWMVEAEKSCVYLEGQDKPK